MAWCGLWVQNGPGTTDKAGRIRLTGSDRVEKRGEERRSGVYSGAEMNFVVVFCVFFGPFRFLLGLFVL